MNELVAEKKPLFRVVVTDFSMPELDGPQTAKIIRQIYSDAGEPQPYIACVTAYTQQAIHIAALSASIDIVLSKPTTAE